ncbi:MAG: hypothetical protein ACO3HV_07070 [Candidatus Nanopelagicales bacterium]
MPTAALATTGSVLTATEYNYLPRGIVARATYSTANQTGITTITDLTSCSVTFTATSGRYYMIVAQTLMASSAATQYGRLVLRNGAGTELFATYAYLTNGEYATNTLIHVSSSLSGSTTLKLSANLPGGSGTLTIGHSVQPTSITVLDMAVA